MKYFDRNHWYPDFYKTSAEINAALDSFGIKGKIITGIHVIGAARNMIPGVFHYETRHMLAREGISYYDIDSGRYPMDSVLLPREVDICEPIVLLFHDGTTLEMMPKNAEGLLISVNRISSEALDGTNHHNFDSDKFFRCLHGHRISKSCIVKSGTNGPDGPFSSLTEKKSMSCCFSLRKEGEPDRLSLYLKQDWNGWYKFGVTQEKENATFAEDISLIPFSEVKAAANKRSQVIIVEGHDGGSYFWIMPVKPSNKARFDFEECKQEEISIEEDDISDFLYYFLDQYFDDDLNGRKPFDNYEHMFEWNLEHNLYTYETMRTMIQDIEECAELLERRYDHPRLDPLKKHFDWLSFAPEGISWGVKLTEQEAESFIRDHVEIAVDFYRRFSRRMSAMLANAADFDLISFMGP